MNYEYLQYWIEAMKDIKLLEQLMENNLHMYLRTQDMLYLEYITNIIKEIFRLKQLSDEYYSYIDEYKCAFRKYYYKGTYSIEESKDLRKLYFTKLPEPFNSKVIKSSNEAGLTDTLVGRMKFLQRWFIELCE